MVVAGPGEVEADRVGLLLAVGEDERTAQFRLAFGGVPLFAEHHVEAVAEGFATAGPGIVRGEGGGVQGAGSFRLGGGAAGAVLAGEVVQECLHHVPGRYFTSVQTGLHALRVALPEHPAPAAALVQARQQSVQVVHELPHLCRELIH